jgi:hypothetical protein
MFSEEANLEVPASVLGQSAVTLQPAQVKYRPELAQCLAKPRGRTLFRKFLNSTLAAENIQFWEEVEVYRSSGGGVEQARRIFDTYVASGAPFQINIDYTMLQETTDSIRTGAPTAFDAAQFDVYRLMADDRWEKFKQSPLFLNYQPRASAISPIKILLNLLVLFLLVFLVYQYMDD